MDTLRGSFGSSDVTDDAADYDLTEEENTGDMPPASIGSDERRMQVRAYNHWAGLLGERNYPSIEDLDPTNLDDFGPYSVLLDFSTGIDDPAVQFLGDMLASECGTDEQINKLSDVPARSLLSRITDHYLQILANQAPIGFEAEFVNQRGSTILYRGILLPFSSDDDTIDFIYGVINWKEMADAVTADELLLEIDQALETDQDEEEAEPVAQAAAPVTDWADGPGAEDDIAEAAEVETPVPAEPVEDEIAPLELGVEQEIDYSEELPEPAFGDYSLDGFDDDEEYDEDGEEEEDAGYDFASLTDHIRAPVKKSEAIDLNGVEAFAMPTEYGGEEDGAADAFGQHDVPAAYEPGDETYATPDVYEASVELPDATDSQVSYDEDAFAAAEEVPAEKSPEEDVLSAEVEAPEAPVEAEVEAPAVADEPAAEAAPVKIEEAAFETPAAEPAPVAAEIQTVASEIEPEVDELPEDAGMYDCLASARELAQTARASEDRSRNALYAAVGRAYDFSLAAQEEPEEYNELVAESGLTVQDRAPMTPVVKLVFGAEYDKTRLTEYAAVLSHAHRVGIARGKLSQYLSEAEGGLKGVVNTERRFRKEEAGKPVEDENELRMALAKKLRQLDHFGLEDLSTEGPEFAVVMIRRTEDGQIAVLGEVDDDVPLIERVGRKIVG